MAKGIKVELLVNAIMVDEKTGEESVLLRQRGKVDAKTVRVSSASFNDMSLKQNDGVLIEIKAGSTVKETESYIFIPDDNFKVVEIVEGRPAGTLVEATSVFS